MQNTYTKAKLNFCYSYEEGIKHILLTVCSIKQLSKVLVQETAHICAQLALSGAAELNTCFS